MGGKINPNRYFCSKIWKEEILERPGHRKRG
jgi:hypothetical protein